MEDNLPKGDDGHGRVNPYKVDVGIDLDQMIHALVLGRTDRSNVLPYSEDDRAVTHVVSAVKSRFGVKIVTGKTRIRNQPWFARYGSDPSTMTETVAETLPLAICRLALLVAYKYSDDGEA